MVKRDGGGDLLKSFWDIYLFTCYFLYFEGEQIGIVLFCCDRKAD